MKFKDMPYKRLELEPTKAALKKIIDDFKNAQTLDVCLKAYEAYDTYSKEIGTAFALSFIRNSLDTTDEFYSGEQDYNDEIGPELQPFWQEMNNALLETPFRGELEKKWGNLMFRNIEIELKTFKDEIVEDLKEENKLSTEYDKLMSSAQIDFDGKTLTLAQMGPYYENSDREIRKAALFAAENWRLENKEELDSIFDNLVKVRSKIAKKLGHENFVETGYYRMQRNCYDKEMVANFRAGVLKHIVPLAAKIKEAQRKRIDVPVLKFYDTSFIYPDGNPTPKGTPEEIFEHGKKMYYELSEETGKFMDFLLESELFDVKTRKGKSGGGYCYTIEKYKAPFIFANFNGTSGDIDVLTHEVGHAYASYMGRNTYPNALTAYPAETAEIHSMSMEFFTWPWMEGFFKEDTNKYYYTHLASALTFLPYGVMVDEFQHHIYERPEMTPEERNKLWLELAGQYTPWLDSTETPCIEEGRFWQRQSHIYQDPFYYIDYCLAQIVALAFWAKDRQNHEEAFEKYRRLVSLQGTKTFVELLEDAGMPSPFISDNLKLVSDEANKFLESYGSI